MKQQKIHFSGWSGNIQFKLAYYVWCQNDKFCPLLWLQIWMEYWMLHIGSEKMSATKVALSFFISLTFTVCKMWIFKLYAKTFNVSRIVFGDFFELLRFNEGCLMWLVCKVGCKVEKGHVTKCNMQKRKYWNFCVANIFSYQIFVLSPVLTLVE